MGFFDRFRRRRQPTREQAERLSRITNPQQRAALLSAIAEGEAIPEYAWNPLPTEFDAAALARRVRERFHSAPSSETQPVEEETVPASTDDVDGEIARCADLLRPAATAESGYLSAPIECPALASARVFTPLLAWAFFNPFGPTLCALHLVRVPRTGERVIFCRSLNPFANSALACGLVPDAVAQDVPRIVSVLTRLFSGSDTPMPNPPTHVQVPPESPLAPTQAREIILSSVKRTRAKELAVTIQRLKDYKGDPWGRTAVERDEAFARLRQGLASPTQASPDETLATTAQLEEWWTAATDPVHVQSEVAELPRAWDGAINFQKRAR